MFNKLAVIPIAVSIAVLSGCGGGGGGGGVIATPAPTPFTSYGAIVKPSTVIMSGSSQEGTYTYNTGTGKLTSVPALSAFANGGSVTSVINAAGTTTSSTATSALGTSISLNVANGDTISKLILPGLIASYSANGQNVILGINHAAFTPAWDYQTFGMWQTGLGTGSGTFGVMTVGAETAGAAVPTTGTFTFSGVAGGHYVNSSGTGVYAFSNVSATTNFATQSIAFATTGTVTTPSVITPVLTSNNNLNMTGALTYAAGSNQFTGAVTTAGGGTGNAAMTGTATGKFYGPAAQEMGGTFGVTGGGTAAYVGGFGAKR